jgi:hypothetical protein
VAVSGEQKPFVGSVRCYWQIDGAIRWGEGRPNHPLD